MLKIKDKIGKFLCKIDWHTPSRKVIVSGINSTSKCNRCGCKIMLDSQGNWFSTAPYEFEEVSNE